MDLLTIAMTGDETEMQKLPTDAKLLLANRLLFLAIEDMKNARDSLFIPAVPVPGRHADLELDF